MGHKTETDAQALARIKERRRKRRIARFALIAAVLVLAITYFTGVFGASISAAADIFDTVTLMVSSGQGYPQSLPLQNFKTANGLNNAVAVLTKSDVYVLSAGGATALTFTHGYANPVLLAAGGRLCVYNRQGQGLTVASRKKVLYTENFEGNIITAAISPGGYVAVAIKSEHYFTSEVAVYSPAFKKIYSWFSAVDYPTRVAIAPNGKTLLVACPGGHGGLLGTNLYFLNTGVEEELFTTQPGQTAVAAHYLSNSKVLVVYNGMAAVYNSNTGAEEYVYRYSGGTLTAVHYSGGRYIALTLQNAEVTSTQTVLLNHQLEEVCTVATEGVPHSIAATKNKLYLLFGSTVKVYATNGELNDTVNLAGTGQGLVTSGKVYCLEMEGIEKLS